MTAVDEWRHVTEIPHSNDGSKTTHSKSHPTKQIQIEQPPKEGQIIQI
jgi:hypothetical protein